jgi:hypothetical protein
MSPRSGTKLDTYKYSNSICCGYTTYQHPRNVPTNPKTGITFKEHSTHTRTPCI